jgi:hypothetical protein
MKSSQRKRECFNTAKMTKYSELQDQLQGMFTTITQTNRLKTVTFAKM